MGHEITGEVVDVGPDVNGYLEAGEQSRSFSNLEVFS
jgi:threonine dehydrogenase-like Zn-dependent dehydrogenase